MKNEVCHYINVLHIVASTAVCSDTALEPLFPSPCYPLLSLSSTSAFSITCSTEVVFLKI